MVVNYLTDIQPYEATLTDQQIADRINASPGKYTPQTFTVAEIASELSGKQQDGPGIVRRVMTAMDAVAASDRLVRNKVAQLDSPGGTVDLGNPLQRAMLQGFADGGALQQSDVDALLGLATAPTPATALDIAAARTEHGRTTVYAAIVTRANDATASAAAALDAGQLAADITAAAEAAWAGS